MTRISNKNHRCLSLAPRLMILHRFRALQVSVINSYRWTSCMQSQCVLKGGKFPRKGALKQLFKHQQRMEIYLSMYYSSRCFKPANPFRSKAKAQKCRKFITVPSTGPKALANAGTEHEVLCFMAVDVPRTWIDRCIKQPSKPISSGTNASKVLVLSNFSIIPSLTSTSLPHTICVSEWNVRWFSLKFMLML